MIQEVVDMKEIPIEESEPIYLVKANNKAYRYEHISSKEKQRRANISKGMKNSFKKMGRPKIINDETLRKSYGKWLCGQVTQKQIADILGISERTVSRRFKKFRES